MKLLRGGTLSLRVQTHGGLKNCSNATYIPRNISNNRKYFPALSIELSSSAESHRFGGGILKPEGGGPAGSAALGIEVEKRA